MQLQIKPHPWGCLVTSFAMALDIPVKQLIRTIGHDGGAIVFPGLPEPKCRAGFHVQECVRACLKYGFSATPLELMPVSAQPETTATHIIGQLDHNWKWFESIIAHSRGVIDGVGRHCGHAIAYDHGWVFDSDGSTYSATRECFEARSFMARRAWIIGRA